MKLIVSTKFVLNFLNNGFKTAEKISEDIGVAVDPKKSFEDIKPFSNKVISMEKGEDSLTFTVNEDFLEDICKPAFAMYPKIAKPTMQIIKAVSEANKEFKALENKWFGKETKEDTNSRKVFVKALNKYVNVSDRVMSDGIVLERYIVSTIVQWPADYKLQHAIFVTEHSPEHINEIRAEYGLAPLQ